jgi:hypothetical protein
MPVITDINYLFDYLKKTVKKECNCSIRPLTAPEFHTDTCPYKATAERAFFDFNREGEKHV